MPGSKAGPGLSWQVGGLLLLLLLLSRADLAAQEAPTDLTQVARELEANLKELRRNITTWRQLAGEAKLDSAQKAAYREQARHYLQACQEYDQALAALPAAKLRQSAAGQKILELRKTFKQEWQYLAEILEQP